MIFPSKFLFVLTLLLPFTLQSQNVFVNLDIGRDSQDNVVFYAENTSLKKFHVVIELTKLVNLRCDCGTIYEGNINQGRTKLFKLVKAQNIGDVDYDYRWSFREGWANPRVNEDVIHMIPAASGNVVTTIGMKSIKETSDEEEVPGNFYSIGFKMNSGDTVFAARRGVVEQIFDGREATGENISFSRKVNKVVVRHKDNTIGSYSVLRNGSFFVEEGQPIEAGAPLAIVSGENYSSGPHVRFSAYYLAFDKRELSNRYTWVYIKPKFTTEHYDNVNLVEDSDYTSLHTQSLILQEWSKRELKKRDKKKKKKK